MHGKRKKKQVYHTSLYSEAVRSLFHTHDRVPRLPGLLNFFPRVSAKESDDKPAEQSVKTPAFLVEDQAGDNSAVQSETIPAFPVDRTEVLDYISKETGRDRLDAFFTFRKDSFYRKDLHDVFFSTFYATWVAFLVSMYYGAREGKRDFIRINQDTVFTTKFKAHRAMNDAMLRGGMKTALRWGLKFGFFAFTFKTLSNSIAAYRNKSGLVEHVAAGSITGALLKYNFGLRGMFASGLLGGALGLVAGGAFYFSQSYSLGLQEDRHFEEVKALLEYRKEMKELSKL